MLLSKTSLKGWKYLFCIPPINPLRYDSFGDGDVYEYNGVPIVRKVVKRSLDISLYSYEVSLTRDPTNIIRSDFKTGYTWRLYDSVGSDLPLDFSVWHLDSESGFYICPHANIRDRYNLLDPLYITYYTYIGPYGTPVPYKEPDQINSIQGPQGLPGKPGNSFVWKSNWISSRIYSINDVVFYSGSSWIATQPNISNIPTNNPTVWSLMSQGGSLK